MAILEIKKYPDRVLRKKAAAIRKVGDKERTLARDMVETMRSARGVGLAAPQVGVSRRLIVIEALDGGAEPLALINPRILKKKGKSSYCEGCLSVPELTSDVIRPEWIAVEALNLDGKFVRIETGGLLARVIQHEADHLDGVLFIDRLGFFRRNRAMKHINSKICVEL
ncbi:MAG: peptide deformylase [Candidatus Omnitrophota bacterium]